MSTKTEAIFSGTALYYNACQGDDKRVLFVCSAGLLRSATGARMYAAKYNTRAAGSRAYALIPVTEELLSWADEVVFVNPENYQDIAQKFDLDSFDCKVTVLKVPDDYDHMDPVLQQHFRDQYEQTTP